jgi:tRNA nucleotidyltransferase (CCA-adding enzyme)
MPDYIYLLENRLSADQRQALDKLREVAREAGTILFLTGDAVRDLTSGHAVRCLEISIHGNALKLKKTIEKAGGTVWGEHEPSQSLYLCFPGTVRVDLVSTHSVTYPKPGKPVYRPASIQEDLRRRDFTANAMAISLNEGSFGLLMDPLNGAADIETRTLRLVSNYGFIEDPSLLIRAIRYRTRLAWEFDPRTRSRYDNAREEGTIQYLGAHERSQELEQIGHEEDGLAVLRALEAEGWMKALFPAWTSARADEDKLNALHELAVSLLMQGVHADMSAAQMQLLTAKLANKDLAELKKLLLRPGFVEEWNSLDSLASGFQKVLLSKDNATPSAGYKLFTSYDPEAVLWLGFTSKSSAVQERYNQFLRVWPEARQNIPHLLMQEMRITPELQNYAEITHAIFLELIDGHLTTPEEMRAFLEPYSPPAPPPREPVKRTRAKRAEKDLDEEENEEDLSEDEDLDDIGGDEDEIELDEELPQEDLEEEAGEKEPGEGELGVEEEEKEAPLKHGKKAASGKVKAEKSAHKAEKVEKKEKSAPVKVESKPAAKAETKPKAAPHAKKAAPAKAAKPAPKAAAKPAAKAVVKAPAKAVAKSRVPVKAVGKGKESKPQKPAAKKAAQKTARKR